MCQGKSLINTPLISLTVKLLKSKVPVALNLYPLEFHSKIKRSGGVFDCTPPGLLGADSALGVAELERIVAMISESCGGMAGLEGGRRLIVLVSCGWSSGKSKHVQCGLHTYIHTYRDSKLYIQPWLLLLL